VVNTSSSKTVTIKNVSSATVNMSSVTGSGYYVAAPSGTTPCGGTLDTGKQCTVTVTFTPLVTGTSLGGVTVVDNSAVSPQVLDASGTGVLAVTLSPSTIAFGTVAVGSTSPIQAITVTNHMSTAVLINSVVASGGFIATAGGSLPCGASVPADSICTLGVEFSPIVTGAVTGALTLSYAAGASPQVVSLSGTGQ
jgi:hypothetical protein